MISRGVNLFGEVDTMKKVYAMLMVYDMLLTGEKFTIDSLCSALNYSRRTCLRYIKELRTYFEVCGVPKKILFDRQLNTFKLVELEEI